MVNLDELATHVDWPTTDTSVSRLSLSNCGFAYFTAESNQVICAVCGVDMKDWQEGNVRTFDKPLTATLDAQRSTNSSSSSLRRCSSSTSNVDAAAGAQQHAGDAPMSRDPETGAPRAGGEPTRRDGGRPACGAVEVHAGILHGDHTLSGGLLGRRQPADGAPYVEHLQHFRADCPLARAVDSVLLDVQMPVDDAIRFTSGDPTSPTWPAAAVAFSPPRSYVTTNTCPELKNRHHLGLTAGSSEHQSVARTSAELRTTVTNTAGKNNYVPYIHSACML